MSGSHPQRFKKKKTKKNYTFGKTEDAVTLKLGTRKKMLLLLLCNINWRAFPSNKKWAKRAASPGREKQKALLPASWWWERTS